MHLVDKISKMRRVSLQMSEELGREPTDDELGEEIGIASGKVSQLKTVSIRPASLDAPISDDDSTEFGEIVGDEEAQTPFELLRDKNLRNEVGGLLDVLDDRERKIIFSRFGLDGGKPKTLEEVGKKFGVTRERIRQLQNIALSKLRRALSKKERPVDVRIAGRGVSSIDRFMDLKRAEETSARFCSCRAGAPPASVERQAMACPDARLPTFTAVRNCTQSTSVRPRAYR